MYNVSFVVYVRTISKESKLHKARKRIEIFIYPNRIWHLSNMYLCSVITNPAGRSTIALPSEKSAEQLNFDVVTRAVLW